jgi:hypothetical protein
MTDERRPARNATAANTAPDDTNGGVTRPALTKRLENPDALLSRTDLRELGLGRRAIDAVFRALPIIFLPGYSRPFVRVRDYLELLARSTYNGDRVR